MFENRQKINKQKVFFIKKGAKNGKFSDDNIFTC